MRRFLAIGLFLAAWSANGAWGAEAEGTSLPLTLQQYAQTLDDSLAAVRELRQEDPQKAGEILSHMPPLWQVETDGHKFDISTDDIRAGLGAWQKEPQGPALEPVL